MSKKYSQLQKELTQESIQTAFYQLLQTHSFQKITITMIAERAGVSRMGVYRYYDNKEAVADTFLDNVLQEMVASLYPIQADAPYQAATKYFEAIEGNKEVFERIIHSELEGLFLKKFDTYVNEYLTRSMEKVPLEEVYSIYRNRFLTAGLYYVSVEWIKRGMQEPISMLAKIPSALAVEVEGDFYFRPGFPLSERDIHPK